MEKETIKITIDGEEFQAKLREFKSGKTGYGLYGIAHIGGFAHSISLNLIKM